MHSTTRQLLLALVCSAWLLSGCAAPAKPTWPAWMTGNSAKVDPGPKVITPRDKMEQLRELSKKGNKLTPELQQQVSRELSQGIAHEQDPVLRAQVLRTLGSVSTEQSATVLTAGLQDHERDVRIAACEALGKRGGPDAAQALSRVLAEDADIDVRLAAARGLGEAANPAGIPALGEALDDQDPAIQYRAMASMKKISGQDFGNDIEAWRQYAKTGQIGPKPSLAQRIRGWF